MTNRTPDEYRRKAEECRARAALAELPEQQAAWARLAEDWDAFANSMDQIARQWSASVESRQG
jgi:hypothetical protein